MPDSASIPVSIEELKAAGIAADTQPGDPFSTKGQVVILPRAAVPGDICYTGPCIHGTTKREVWYFDNNLACTVRAEVPDHACGA